MRIGDWGRRAVILSIFAASACRNQRFILGFASIWLGFSDYGPGWDGRGMIKGTVGETILSRSKAWCRHPTPNRDKTKASGTFLNFRNAEGPEGARLRDEPSNVSPAALRYLPRRRGIPVCMNKKRRPGGRLFHRNAVSIIPRYRWPRILRGCWVQRHPHQWSASPVQPTPDRRPYGTG